MRLRVAIPIAAVLLLALTNCAIASASDPLVTLEVSPTIVSGSGSVQITATIDNTSGDFALESPSLALTLPPGTSLTSGVNPATTASVPTGSTDSAVWIVQVNTAGQKNFSVEVTGTLDGNAFVGSDSATLEVDADPPTVAVSKPPTYSTTATPTFQWSGLDSQSAVATFDVESAIDNAPWTPWLTATTQTSGSLPAAGEGQTIHVRVRGTDLFGNTSDWTEVSTMVDVIPPVASIGPLDKSTRGTLRIPLFFSNVGSPVKATYTFANSQGGRTGAATNGQIVSYVNLTNKIDTASFRLVAKDALGREASVQQVFNVESGFVSSGLKFSKLKKSGAGIAVAGKVSAAYTGKVTVTATRVGAKGTKKVTKTVTAKKGAFAAKLRAKPGTYKVVASTPKTSKFTATSVSKKLAIR